MKNYLLLKTSEDDVVVDIEDDFHNCCRKNNLDEGRKNGCDFPFFLFVCHHMIFTVGIKSMQHSSKLEIQLIKIGLLLISFSASTECRAVEAQQLNSSLLPLKPPPSRCFAVETELTALCFSAVNKQASHIVSLNCQQILEKKYFLQVMIVWREKKGGSKMCLKIMLIQCFYFSN